MTAITRFRGAYAFLSNFYGSLIVVNGITFPTVEHAFQAAKVALTYSPEERLVFQRRFAAAKTPAEAKRLGRLCVLRADWKTAHLPLMKRLLRLKFAAPALRAALLETGSLPLIEGNDWNDTYWGVCNGSGRNQLGVLLMELRAELAEAPKPQPAPKRPVKTNGKAVYASKPSALSAIQPSRDQLIDRNIAAGIGDCPI